MDEINSMNSTLPPPEVADFSWRDDFLVGDPQMDAVHREFVELVAALAGSSDADMLAHLDAFVRHAREHFAAEDQSMRESGFPPRDCHIDEHAAILASCEEVRERVAQGDAAIARELASELTRWFPAHAAHLDSALAHWLVKRRHGAKPLVFRRHVSPTAA